MKKTAIVDGVEVSIGDYVSFKSDHEQTGQIVDIKTSYNGTVLCLEDEHGFGGDYLRYATYTEERASDCWIG